MALDNVNKKATSVFFNNLLSIIKYKTINLLLVTIQILTITQNHKYLL